MKKMAIDKDHRIQLPTTVARHVGDKPLSVASQSGWHVLLSADADGADVSLAGSLAEFSVADLLSFVNMFRKTGVLRFSFSEGHKDLYFHQGEIVYAASSFPEEDLGEVLYGLGKIERGILTKARQFVSEKTPLGKVLVAKGFVEAKDLWMATRNQVETIVYHLFSFHEGSFCFVSKDLNEEEIVRLSMSTQNLIMEGLRRVDERALFMRSIGDLERVPTFSGGKVEGLTGPQERMLEIIRQDPKSASELLRKSGVGEFDALKLLYQLVEKKVVRMEEAKAVDVGGDFGEILALYNGALVSLYQAVSPKNQSFRDEVRSFFRDLPQPFSYVFRDTSLEEDGSLSGRSILANLEGLEEGDKMKLMADSLNELLYMECITARKELGTVGSSELIQRVQKIANRIKELVGRKG